ncbi:MAG: DUF6370 family protein, partial [Lentisphaeraceae bacterium]|nr:DUF6370 family protein [Lentisphaeraceae bacterium]
LKDALIEGNFEIACGKCMIKAEECKECQLTVKYKDQVYPITGYDIDVEKIGLCATSANADIVGTLKNNIFSVKTLENIKLNLPENLQKGADDALNKLKGLGF